VNLIYIFAGEFYNLRTWLGFYLSSVCFYDQIVNCLSQDMIT
jgi:hypothetical protein